MGLPIGGRGLGRAKGNKGDTGTIAYATAETVPSDQPASVEMVGPASNRGAHFKVPRGLSALTSSDDAALAAIVAAAETATGQALRDLIGDRTGVTVNLKDYPTLFAACAALPANGGTILVPKGRFYAGGFSTSNPMVKPNVTIIGVKLPQLAFDCSSLYDGSVIEGSFLAHAENFVLHNVGFDMGKSVVEARWPTLNPHVDSHPTNGATWEPFGFKLPLGGGLSSAKRGVFIGDIICLNYDPQTIGHSMLIEGVTSGKFGNLIGVGSSHGIALKVQNVDIESLTGMAAGANGITVKSDSYAQCGSVRIKSAQAHRVPPGTVPWWGTTEPMPAGMALNPETASFTGPVEVGVFHSFGATAGLSVIASDATNALVGAHFGSVFADGGGRALSRGINGQVAWADRISIDYLVAQNIATGIRWVLTSSPLTIGRASIVNATTRAIETANNASVDVGLLEVKNTPIAYSAFNNSRIRVGRESFELVTTRFENNFGPHLGNGWTSVSGQPVTITLENGRVSLSGVAQSDGTSVPVIYIPTTNFSPSNPYTRIPAIVKRGAGAYATEMVTIAADKLQVGDGALLASGSQVCLDGISWDLKSQW